MVNVTVKFDPQLDDHLMRNVEQAQKILDSQVMKDTDPYVPMDSGTLKDSAIRASTTPGEIVYDGPYAKAQYYGLPNKSKDKHPLAVKGWFEAAKAANKATWLRVAKKAGGQGQ